MSRRTRRSDLISPDGANGGAEVNPAGGATVATATADGGDNDDDEASPVDFSLFPSSSSSASGRRRPPPAGSSALTQDCVGWDEGENAYDLRQLFRTPTPPPPGGTRPSIKSAVGRGAGGGEGGGREASGGPSGADSSSPRRRSGASSAGGGDDDDDGTPRRSHRSSNGARRRRVAAGTDVERDVENIFALLCDDEQGDERGGAGDVSGGDGRDRAAAGGETGADTATQPRGNLSRGRAGLADGASSSRPTAVSRHRHRQRRQRHLRQVSSNPRDVVRGRVASLRAAAAAAAARGGTVPGGLREDRIRRGGSVSSRSIREAVGGGNDEERRGDRTGSTGGGDCVDGGDSSRRLLDDSNADGVGGEKKERQSPARKKRLVTFSSKVCEEKQGGCEGNREEGDDLCFADILEEIEKDLDGGDVVDHDDCGSDRTTDRGVPTTGQTSPSAINGSREETSPATVQSCRQEPPPVPGGDPNVGMSNLQSPIDRDDQSNTAKANENENVSVTPLNDISAAKYTDRRVHVDASVETNVTDSSSIGPSSATIPPSVPHEPRKGVEQRPQQPEVPTSDDHAHISDNLSHTATATTSNQTVRNLSSQEEVPGSRVQSHGDHGVEASAAISDPLLGPDKCSDEDNSSSCNGSHSQAHSRAGTRSGTCDDSEQKGECTEDSHDPFGSPCFAMEDLAAMDVLVHAKIAKQGVVADKAPNNLDGAEDKSGTAASSLSCSSSQAGKGRQEECAARSGSRGCPVEATGEKSSSIRSATINAKHAMGPGQAPVTEAVQENNDADDDPFGDLPDIDLDEIDRVMLQTQQKPTGVPSKSTTSPSEPASEDPFGSIPDDSFEEMDRLIAKQSVSHSDAPVSSEIQAASSNIPMMMEEESDPFGGIPDMNFEEMDQLIAGAQQHQSSSMTSSLNASHAMESRGPCGISASMAVAPSPTVPIRNPMVTATETDRSEAGNDFNCPKYLSFSRYRVVDVTEDIQSYTKTLCVVDYFDSLQSRHFGETSSSQGGNGCDRTPAERGSTASTAPNKHPSCQRPIFLRGEWYDTVVERGDVVHLVSVSGRWRTDLDALPLILHSRPPAGSNEDDLLLVLHPDLLVTPSNISDAVTCPRRSVLRKRMGSSPLTNRSAVMGTLRHGLFQFCMHQADFSLESAKKNVRRVLQKNAETLLGCGMVEDDAFDEVLETLGEIKRFVSTYTDFVDSNNCVQNQWNSTSHTKVGTPQGSKLEGHKYKTDIWVCAHGVHATEESAVTPELGLKGNVDLTVNASTRNVIASHDAKSVPVGSELQALMGVELKTGHSQKPHDSHTAQLALYTLMLRARHGSAILAHETLTGSNRKDVHDSSFLERGSTNGGMLLYLNHKGHKAVHVTPTVGEIKSLMNQRNHVARAIRRASKRRGVVEKAKDLNVSAQEDISRIDILPVTPAALPEILFNTHECERCYSNKQCMLYARSDIALAKKQSAPLSSPSANVDRSWLNACDSIGKSHAHLLEHFTGLLGEKELIYFQDWDRMIDLEASESKNNIVKSWLVPSAERERDTGKCIASLEWDSGFDNAAPSSSERDPDSNILLKFNRKSSTTTAKTTEHSISSDTMPALTNLKIESGDRIVVSTDGSLYHESQTEACPTTKASFRAGEKSFRRRVRQKVHIIQGRVENVTDSSVIVVTSSNDAAQFRQLVRTWTSPPKGPRSNSDNTAILASDLLWRIDKDEFSSGAGLLRQNLINFFTADVPSFTGRGKSKPIKTFDSDSTSERPFPSERMMRLRNSIVNLVQPRFNNEPTNSLFSPSVHSPTLNGCHMMDLALEYHELNRDQRQAVHKIICAEDYAVVQGLPGTGKTSMISFVARLLAARGNRVLITSYTHSAVDNLMLKLMERGVGSLENEGGLHSGELVRIGRKSDCHRLVHGIVASHLACSHTNDDSSCPISGDDTQNPLNELSARSLRDVITAARIVGVSALSVARTPLLLGQQFDVVIVDEAGQISQPAILGALMAADRFVLVGDHMQLPPLVSNEAAERAGYGISMLRRLAEQHPETVLKLTLQYRMHGDICDICNTLVYKGSLECANDGVRNQRLRLTHFPSRLPKPHTRLPLRPQVNESKESEGWLLQVLEPNNAVVFADTDGLGTGCSLQSIDPEGVSRGNNATSQFFGLEQSTIRKTGRNDGSIVNTTEIVLVRNIVHAFLECGLEVSDIGVICPYRSQVSFVSSDCKCTI